MRCWHSCIGNSGARLPVTCGASVATTPCNPPHSCTGCTAAGWTGSRALQNRAQFYGQAAQMMRHILVDHARRHRAARRPGAALQVALDDGMHRVEPRRLTLRVEDDGTRARWIVEDNGIGLGTMPPAAVFARQAPAANPADALGIGLSVSRSLAARHGGTLDYAPASASGCAFTLSLPS